jgi:hypothetical protein
LSSEWIDAQTLRSMKLKTSLFHLQNSYRLEVDFDLLLMPFFVKKVSLFVGRLIGPHKCKD